MYFTESTIVHLSLLQFESSFHFIQYFLHYNDKFYTKCSLKNCCSSELLLPGLFSYSRKETVFPSKKPLLQRFYVEVFLQDLKTTYLWLSSQLHYCYVPRNYMPPLNLFCESSTFFFFYSFLTGTKGKVFLTLLILYQPEVWQLWGIRNDPPVSFSLVLRYKMERVMVSIRQYGQDKSMAFQRQH